MSIKLFFKIFVFMFYIVLYAFEPHVQEFFPIHLRCLQNPVLYLQFSVNNNVCSWSVYLKVNQKLLILSYGLLLWFLSTNEISIRIRIPISNLRVIDEESGPYGQVRWGSPRTYTETIENKFRICEKLFLHSILNLQNRLFLIFSIYMNNTHYQI